MDTLEVHDLIDNAQRSLDRACESQILQVSERHALLALAQASLAQAAYLSRIADALEEITGGYVHVRIDEAKR